MKLLIVILAALCLAESAQGYMCYECNSTIDANCFDFLPTFNMYKAVPCDVDGKGMETCYAIQFSERKQRRMYRGCKKNGICDKYDDIDDYKIHMKVITCSECNEHYCNGSAHRRPWTHIITLLSILVTTLSH